jgi:pimeloyl-ACP methyl ester carboxylesterase
VYIEVVGLISTSTSSRTFLWYLLYAYENHLRFKGRKSFQILRANINRSLSLMAPTVVFVPGIWEGPAPFARVTELLSSQGYRTHTAALLSTGTVSPDNPSMKDDTVAIRQTIEKLTAAGEDVVLVLHSAGGFLGSIAIEGLTRKAYQEKGLKGGVAKIVFLTAAVVPEGTPHSKPPFAYYDVCFGKS